VVVAAPVPVPDTVAVPDTEGVCVPVLIWLAVLLGVPAGDGVHVPVGLAVLKAVLDAV